MMYVQDYDETYPLSAFWSYQNFAAEFYLWSSQRCVQPYIKNKDIDRCPSDTFTTTGYADIYSAGMPTSISMRPISYMANGLTPGFTGTVYGVAAPRGIMVGSTYYASGDGPTAMADVPAPADIVMLVDGRKQYYADWYGCGPWLNDEIEWCYGAGEDVMWWWQFPLFIYATPGTTEYNVWRKHSGGTTVAFADGHSKMLRPGDLDQGKRWLVNPLP